MPVEDVDLDKIPDHVEVFERDGEKWGRDTHGEFKLSSGSRVPLTEDDVPYTPCNAVLKYTWDRYGETRYCTGMAAGNFSKDVREFPDLCKHHQARGHMRKRGKEMLKTGAFATSYASMYDKLEPHEQIVCNEMFKNLLDESVHDFEPREVEQTIDLSDADWIEADEAEITLLVPTKHVTRAKALWFAALDFLRAEKIEEQLFEAAQAEDLAVGEKKFVVAVTDDGEPIWAKDEHHLNLTLSRIVKDYDEHMKFGGVRVEAGGEEGDFEDREWVLLELPDDEVAPEQRIPDAPKSPIELAETADSSSESADRNESA